MNRTDDEIRAIVKATVAETLVKLGVDIEDPLEVQADFRHLRSWRQSSDTIKRQGLVTAVGVLVIGVLGLIWAAIKGHV